MIPRIRRSFWYVFAGAVVVASGAITFFLLGQESERANEIQAATQVFDDLRSGEPRGFDPSAWKLAVNKAEILPAGGRIRVLPTTWDVRGTFASVDVEVIVEGRPMQRQWVFLHKVHGEWLIYGSLSLDGER